MERVSLFEEFRLIERSESEINGAWKGAHLLLFFMAFVFGSFCTFCFHMLMYLFDEKCVLFPKLLSLTSLRHNVIYEFIPSDKETADMLPVDFVGTQWLEKSACYLPTYVPLVSGIFGLVWTTMFLMCSTGSRNLTGLHRPYRVLLPIFVFSLAMGGTCVYSSSVTHYGLNELCIKLGEITGSATCTYTVNVATLAYERRIRGVYQAIRLTILSAWLHTICWLLSALLTLMRVVLAVDFQLVRINVDLVGDIDKMLEHHETQIRTVSPDVWYSEENDSTTSGSTNKKTNKKSQLSRKTETKLLPEDVEVISMSGSEILYVNKNVNEPSDASILSEEGYTLTKLAAFDKTPTDKHFIVNIIYDLVKGIILPETQTSPNVASDDESVAETEGTSKELPYTRPLMGRDKLSPKGVNFRQDATSSTESASPKETKEIAKAIRHMLKDKLNAQLRELHSRPVASVQTSASSSKDPDLVYESSLNLTNEMKDIIETKRASDAKTEKKSNLKHVSVQAGKTKNKKTASPRVHITEPENIDKTTETPQDAEKETQTARKKEKQD